MTETPSAPESTSAFRAAIPLSFRTICLRDSTGRRCSCALCRMPTGWWEDWPGEGGRPPNPHLLMRPFLRREAVLSSRIEGTQATLGELLAAEAGAAVERSPADLREVGNYVTALEYGVRRLKKLPLSLRLIRELHAKLMTGVRGKQAVPGSSAVRRTGSARPAAPWRMRPTSPPPDEMTTCLEQWETFLHDRSLPPLVQVALAHYQFEAIHPFLDGNGRVGRLLITLFLVERGILPTPLLYLSAFFEATRRDYYDRLFGVSTRGSGRFGWNTFSTARRVRPRTR